MKTSLLRWVLRASAVSSLPVGFRGTELLSGARRLIVSTVCALAIESPTVMANLYYKERLIIAYASLNQSTKLWSPGAEITWKQEGQRFTHTIGGLEDRFKTCEEAERFVIHLAETWIEANP